MEIADNIGGQAACGDAWHEAEDRDHGLLNEIGWCRCELDRDLHHDGHNDEGEESHDDSLTAFLRPVDLGENVGSKKSGRIDDVAKRRLKTEEVHVFGDLNVCHDD